MAEEVRAALADRQDEILEVVGMPGTKDAPGGTRARAFTIPAELDEATAWVVAEASKPLRTVSVSIGSLTPAAASRIAAPGGWPRASASRAAEERIDLLLGYLWVAVDLDPDKQNPESVEELVRRLHPLPQPTRIVSSGSGVHAWWHLDRMFPAASGQHLLRVLAAAVGGDTGTAHPTRALRLAGTWNHKPSAGRLAEVIGGSGRAVDAVLLLERAQALAPPAPEPPAAAPRQRPALYDGDDLRERARSRLSLPDLLDKACGPPTRAGWSCFAHEDGTPSLRLVQGSETAAICYGSGHPPDVGMQKDGYVALDAFDVVAWTWGVPTSDVVRDLVAQERITQRRAGRATGTPGLLAMLDAATGRGRA